MLRKLFILSLFIILIFGCQAGTTQPPIETDGGCGVSAQGFENCEVIDNIRYCDVIKGA